MLLYYKDTNKEIGSHNLHEQVTIDMNDSYSRMIHILLKYGHKIPRAL